VIKAVLHATGRIASPDVRLPLLPPDPATVAAALNRLAATELTCGSD
jgi:4-hydroxy-tetrahydrodipicolinate synthase